MHIDELVLDWNGTVMDDLDRAWAATNRLLTRAGCAPVTRAAFRARFGLPLAGFFAALGVSAERLAEVERDWNTRVRATPAPLAAGAMTLLSACKARGVSVGVVTGADPAVVAADARRHGIRPLLAWVVGPVVDKAAVLATAAAAGRTVAYVGDTEHDVTSARAAGLLAVATTAGYTPAARLRRAKPDLVIDDLAALVPLLRVTCATRKSR